MPRLCGITTEFKTFEDVFRTHSNPENMLLSFKVRCTLYKLLVFI